jgi:hypothetical protein
MCGRVLYLLILAGFCVGCADQADSNEMAATEAAMPRTMNDRFNNRSKEGYYQDGEGNWKTNNNKRSSFESVGRSNLDRQQYSGKTYQAERVEKSSWWGNKRYDAARYAGNTSADQFKTAAGEAAQAAPESGDRSMFSSQSFATRKIARQSAHENAQSSVMQDSAAARESQRADVQPSITDWKEQRTLELKDTKSWLNK